MTRSSILLTILFALSAAPVGHAALPTPVRLPVTPVAAGAMHAYQLKGGILKGFGYDGDGRMGIGWTSNSRLATETVPGLSDVTQVSVGNSHTLVLKKDGTVWAWGNNIHGQVGDGTLTWANTPLKVAGLVGIKKVVARDMTSFALANHGKLYAWGSNTAGQLGSGRSSMRSRQNK